MPGILAFVEFASHRIDHRVRDEAILWIKQAIARNGITRAQLDAAGCFDAAEFEKKVDLLPKYIDASGRTWDSVGAVPEWLQRAINAGQSIAHFRAGYPLPLP